METLKSMWVDLLLMTVIFATLVFFLRARLKKKAANRTEKPKLSFCGRILYLLRLLGFALVSFMLVSMTLIFYHNWVSFQEETVPAPSRVEIPPDLPFGVEEVTFLSEDGLKIAGWYVPPQNGTLVILLHGYGGNRLSMRWYAERLVEAGYGVLMYDERASGESEGDHRSYGWEDPQDVGGALEFLNARGDANPHRIGIVGCSIGGQIALQGAAFYPQIGAVWADGPSTVRAQDMPAPTNPIMALIYFGNFTLDWVYTTRLDMPAPAPMIEIIGSIAPRPIVMVGGGTPMPIMGSEAEHLQKYLRYAGENADLWVISEAFHCDGPGRRPAEYASRMIEFFDTAFEIERR